MRVIAGKAKGVRLKGLRGLSCRPTSDKVKEALFDILGEDKVAEARVLDLYAGTGSLGIEALSRGAREAVFVEIDSRCIGMIKENLKRSSFASQGRVIKRDALRAMRFLKGERFEVIFADPPYGMMVGPKIVESVAHNQILAQGGVLVLEHFFKEQLPIHQPPLRLWRRACYGQTCLSFYGQEE